jgi:hypothetical protein
VDVIVPAPGHDKMIRPDGFPGPNHPHVRNTGLAADRDEVDLVADDRAGASNVTMAESCEPAVTAASPPIRSDA